MWPIRRRIARGKPTISLSTIRLQLRVSTSEAPMLLAPRPLIFSLLLCPVLTRLALAQRDTFDIASFESPAGWERSQRPGFLVFQSGRIQNGRMTSGQILVFQSRPTSASPADNFAAEWYRLVAQPLRVSIPPRIETRQGRDGWTLVIGTTAPQPANPITSVLYTTSG